MQGYVDWTGPAGERDAKIKALNDAAKLGANSVVWTQVGSGAFDSQAAGQVYFCGEYTKAEDAINRATYTTNPAIAMSESAAHASRAAALYANGSYEAAFVEYKAAYSVRPLVLFEYYMAQCYDKMVNLPRAIEHYRTYVNGTQTGELREHAVERIVALTSQIESVAAQPTEPPPAEPPPKQVSPVLSTVQGSCFFVSTVGLAVTNYHVIASATRVTIADARQDRLLNVSVLSASKKLDLAILRVEEPQYRAPNFLPMATKPPVLGEQVFTIGFPVIGLLGIDPKFTDGAISALSANETQYQISVPVQHGNSGGPLVNSRGEVVGVVNAMFSDSTMIEETGVVAHSISFAIKGEELVTFARGISLQKQPATRTRAEAITRTENAVCLVLATRQ